jgi:hypothetical protein
LLDQGDEEQDGDEEEESGGVMVRCLREQEEDEGEDDYEECERFPSTDFSRGDHRWLSVSRLWHDEPRPCFG